tara:strand:+ start:443 stop:727 length:285 start_codon:yes stop_codon:yes gene_type:complete
MKIQPVTTWFNGEPQTATNFTLISINDNFTTSAVLYYELQKEIVNEEVVSYENLITATLDISGQDYKDWSVEPDANTWIYNWAAGKLNLVLITE